VAGRCQRVSLGGQGVRVADVQQPLELDQRLGMILHTQFEDPLPPLPLAGHDQQRCGLTPAYVPARILAGNQCREQPSAQRSCRTLERLAHRRPDAR